MLDGEKVPDIREFTGPDITGTFEMTANITIAGGWGSIAAPETAP